MSLAATPSQSARLWNLATVEFYLVTVVSFVANVSMLVSVPFGIYLNIAGEVGPLSEWGGEFGAFFFFFAVFWTAIAYTFEVALAFVLVLVSVWQKQAPIGLGVIAGLASAYTFQMVILALVLLTP